MCYGLAIYKPNGNLHKDLVILGLMLFAIFEATTPQPQSKQQCKYDRDLLETKMRKERSELQARQESSKVRP